MTAEKTQVPADPGVSVTLYKSVTATVTWEQVRTAAKAMGMRLTKLEGAEDIEAWVHDSGRRVYIGGGADDMGHEVETLSRLLVDVSPGEMLMRIVGVSADASALDKAQAFVDAGSAIGIDGMVDAIRELLPMVRAYQEAPYASARCLDCRALRRPGEPCAYCDGPDPSLPWRRRPESWAKSIAAAGITDEVAADMFAAWLAQSRAQTDVARMAEQQAAEDMRDRCAEVAEQFPIADGTTAREGTRDIAIVAAIRALSLTAEPTGARVSDETRHPDTADIIRDAAKAWGRMADGITRVHVAVDVPVETFSVEEPDAGPYDDRCRWFLGNRGARCRYVFDHHKRGVPCAARTSAAPPVADASAELRARLVAELHAAGRPKLADRMSVDVGWRSLVDFVNPEILDMLSESLRKDLKTEVPK